MTRSNNLSRSSLAIMTFGLAAVVFLAVNVFAGSVLRTARVDLTQDRIHTLSQGTINTLAKLDEPIKLRLYYSAKVAAGLPRFRTFGQHVQDLLAEYKGRAGSKLVVEIVDPEPFSALEDEAAQIGLRGMPTESGETFYFGIVGTNQADGREIIPYLALDRENFIEYDLSRLIANLNRGKKPVVGLMTDLPLAYGPGGMMAAMRGQSRPYVIYEEFAKHFDVKTLPMTADSIDPEIKVLVLAHPATITPDSLYAIDQFVLRGGRLIALVVPFAEAVAASSRGQGGPPTPDSSTLAPLFAKWGVEMATDKFVADRKNAQRVMFMDQGQQRQMGYPAWLHLGEGAFDKADVAVAQFKSINMGSAGALKPLANAKTKMVPLIRSSDDASLVAVSSIATTPDPVALNRDFKPGGEIYTLAARIIGEVETAFPDGKPKSTKPADPANATPAAKNDQPALKVSNGPINVVIVADTDLLDDKFWVQTAELPGQRVVVPSADNGNFIVGLIDNMSGSGDLIGLRARPPVARPFTRVDDMRRQAEQRFLAEEKRLQGLLADTEKRLSELNIKGRVADGAQPLSPAQLEEVAKFQKQRADTRLELREVQRKLRADIDRLDAILKIINIAAVPLLLALFAIFLSVYQARARRARIAQLKLSDRTA